MGFQQGLSGLNAASRNLDVIGHNIANSNTTGFKGSRSEFADIVATSIGAAGGSNAGIGVEVANVAQQFSQGNITITGNNLDVAINGGGFFRLQQADGSAAYTRAGNFKLNKVGDMVSNGGAKVMGFKVDPLTGTGTSEATPLSFPTGAPIPAKQTGKLSAVMNLDARTPDAAGNATATPPVLPTPRSTFGTSLNVFDTQGVAIPVNLYFVKTDQPNEWNVYNTLDETVQPAGSPLGVVKFDQNGKVDAATSTLTLNVSPTANPNAGASAPAVIDFDVEIDLNKATQFGSKFAVTDLQQDGYASGELTSINVSNDGMVLASYSNGVTRAEAQVALANFRNPQGLSSVGGNNWVESNDSGAPVMGKPGTGNLGMLRAGALEDSNVDLTAELVNMMTAQRTYQANAQTIKTQDQVMSTLVNLR